MKKFGLLFFSFILLTFSSSSFAFSTNQSSQINYLGKFLADVYSALFGTSQTSLLTKAEATGSVTIHALIGKRETTGGAITNTRPATASELAGFSYKIERIEGRGTNTKITTVIDNARAEQTYSLAANDPSTRDEYFLIVKDTPENITYDPGIFGGIYFKVAAGQNTDVTVTYYVALSTAKPGAAGEPIEVTIDADVVDYKGNFVRNLTAEEKNRIKFEVKQFDSSSNYGGEVGTFENAGKATSAFPSPAGLGTFKNVPVRRAAQVNNFWGYRLLDIELPSGYSLRSITSEIIGDENVRHNGYNQGTLFVPPLVVPRSFWEQYQDILGPYGSVPKFTLKLHLAEVEDSRVQKKDKLLFVGENNSGLDFVKRIVQTYTDNEGLYLERHSNDRVPHNAQGKRPFPSSFQVVSNNGKNYLVLNARSQIHIYDVTNPTNPNLVEKFNVAENLSSFQFLAHGAGVGTASGWPQVGDVFFVDGSPYVLANYGYGGGNGMSGIVILRLDKDSMKLSFDEKLAWINYRGGNRAYGQYKGSDGKIYFVASMSQEDEGTKGIKLPSKSSSSVFGIFTLDSSGQLKLEKTLQEKSGFNYRFNSQDISSSSVVKDFPLDNAKLENVGDKTLLLVSVSKYITTTESPSLKIIDITDPQNASVVASLKITDGVARMAVDRYQKRLIIVEGSGKVDVFDIANPSSPQKLADYSNLFELLGINEQSGAVLELKKRLKIPSSENILPALSNYFNTSPSFSSLAVANGKIFLSVPTGSNFLRGETEYSDYNAWYFQFFADIKDLSNRKVLGMILPRQIFYAATGSSPQPLEYCYAGQNVLFYRDRYIYRANCHLADVWEFKNITASSAPPTPEAPGAGGTTLTPQPSSQPQVPPQGSIFSIRSIYNWVKRVIKL